MTWSKAGLGEKRVSFVFLFAGDNVDQSAHPGESPTGNSLAVGATILQGGGTGL